MATEEMTNEEKETALLYAVAYLEEDDVRGLLDSGVSVNCTDTWRRTPLHRAAARGRLNILEILVTAGAQIEAKMSASCIFLHNPALDAGCTPLHVAAERKWADSSSCIRALIKHGAQIDAPEDRGQTPLHYAAAGGSSQNALALLQHGANKDAKDEDGNTPLHIAALQGNGACIAALYSKHASLTAVNKSLKSPVDLAQTAGIKKQLDKIQSDSSRQVMVHFLLVALHRRIKLPLNMCFNVLRCLSTTVTFQISFSEGKLGIGFRRSTILIVTRGGQAWTGGLRKGDMIEAIASWSTFTKNHKEISAKIKSTPRPVVIAFRRN